MDTNISSDLMKIEKIWGDVVDEENNDQDSKTQAPSEKGFQHVLMKSQKKRNR